MHELLMQPSQALLAVGILDILGAIVPYLLIFFGFSAVIFVHELGHFAVAKWCGVRVEKFCIGFGRELFGFSRGETRYGFNLLPLGGYVKMLGQEDFEIDATGELQHKEDPRSFANKTVAQRMLIVSAGVVMNVIFAALLFMVVFMVGTQVLVTEVGFVMPNSPAAIGGLQVGDKVIGINGEKINEFNEINMAIMLAEPFKALDFEVERDGQVKHLKLVPENNEERNVLMVGMGPAFTRLIVATPTAIDPSHEDLPRVGDKICELNGQEVNDDNANEMFFAIINNPERRPEVIVERLEDPENPDSKVKRVNVEISPTIRLYPSDPTSRNLINVLGFSPMMRFEFVEPGGPADKAGIKSGDVVTKIGDIEFPSMFEIADTIRSSCMESNGSGPDDFEYVENDISITLLRVNEAKPIETVLRPKVRKHMFKRNSFPRIGGSYDQIADNLLRVSRAVAEVDGVATPAAKADILPGSQLEKINDTPLASWVDLVDAFHKHAGSTVQLSYLDPDGVAKSIDLDIPLSLRSKLGLGVVSTILSVDGDETVEVEFKGKKRRTAVSHWFGLKTKLAQCVGQTVAVRYIEGKFGEPKTAQVEISADMVDPWLGRVDYMPNVQTAQARRMFQTSNPIEAIGIGVRKTYYFVLNVYTTIERMVFTRSVGVEHLSGPVGIVKLGSDIASAGFTQLLFFLAIISANLAVINFLPLPIVDGGLMVFLLIEKIKGTPVSIKTQVVTQVIGVVLIIAAFVFVTIQDLQRMFG